MFQNSLRIAAGLLSVAAAAFAQAAPAGAGTAAAPTPKLAFEVASIKSAPPLDPMAIASGKAHIGMSVDKARVDIGGANLMGLVCLAYKVKPYQVAGNPEWMNIGMTADRFDILAKMPDGANKDQVPEMLQTLLAERFKLQVHHDTRETPVYALVIGKGGLKMKEVPDDPPPATTPASEAASASGDPPPGANDKPAPPAKGEMSFGSGDNKVTMKQTGNGAVVNSKETGPMTVAVDNGVIHMAFQKAPIDTLISMLSQYLDRPVVDLTGLKGKYQASLDLAMADALRMAQKMGVNVPMAPGGNASRAPAEAASDPSGSSLFTSVQQLGLKLDPRKLPYDYIVIDHVEKMPTEN